jgi:hypothetical protein
MKKLDALVAGRRLLDTGIRYFGRAGRVLLAGWR